MATEGCLPLFHTGGDAGQDEVELETMLAQDPILQDDHLLSELLRSEGVRGVCGGEGAECACGEGRVALCSPITSRVFSSGPDPHESV